MASVPTSKEQIEIFEKSYSKKYWLEWLKVLSASGAILELEEHERLEIYKNCEMTEKQIEITEFKIDRAKCFICKLLESRCMKH